jgi:hypothetical protein
MASTDEVDSYLIKMGLPYEQVGQGTWVVRPDSARHAQIGVQIDEPIVLFSIQMFKVEPQQAAPHEPGARENLYRTLLELNAELLHSCYALQGDQVVLSGAQQLENLDFNEFQAVVEDMSMALDNHYDKIAPWLDQGTRGTKAAGAEGST